jgi:hypothetical protein
MSDAVELASMVGQDLSWLGVFVNGLSFAMSVGFFMDAHFIFQV